MKRHFSILLMLVAYTLCCPAQTVSELFVSLPLEKTPLLTLNDKKEMIECWNQKLDTSVQNKLHGTSKIDSLADDCIKVKLSEAKSLTMFVCKREGKPTLVGVITTLYSPKGESTLDWYDENWNRVAGPTPELPEISTQTSESLTLVEYIYDSQSKSVKAICNYPMKMEQIDK